MRWVGGLDEDLTPEPATTIVADSIKLGDNLTDEVDPSAAYAAAGKTGADFTGDIASVGADSATADFDTALALDSGLTNDTKPTLSFSLDNELSTGQQVVVTRYTIVNGIRTNAEEVLTKTTGKDFEYQEAELEQTYGTDYEYEIQLLTDGKVTATQSHTFRLDTMVEAMQVTEATFNDTKGSATVVLTARDNSELNATVSATYTSGGKEVPATVSAVNGVYTLTLDGFDRFDPAGLKVTVVDAAGNVRTETMQFMRNLFSSYNLVTGPDSTKDRDGIAVKNDGGFDDANRIGGKQLSADAASGDAFVPTAGNDTLILGLDQFGALNALNGSLSDQNYWGNVPAVIDTGAGDDFIHVRGAFQGFEGNASSLKMGDGNDKLQLDENVVAYTANPKFVVDMGEGNNLINLKGWVAAGIQSAVTFGSGNDTMLVGSNFDGKKNVNFGDGDNVLKVGGYVANTGTISFGTGDDAAIISSNFTHSTMTTGDGKDTVIIGGDVLNSGNAIRETVIDTGAGDDVINIAGRLSTGGTLGDSTADLKILAGEGNDEMTITGQAYRGLVDMGAGDDSLTIGKVYLDSNPNQLRLDGGEGNDTIYLTGTDNEQYSMRTIKNFETIDMSDAKAQYLFVEHNYLTEVDTNTELFIKGGSEDKVNFGPGGRPDGDLRDTIGNAKVVWSKIDAEQRTVDGVTYDAYTVASSDQWVYIQQGVQVI